MAKSYKAVIYLGTNTIETKNLGFGSLPPSITNFSTGLLINKKCEGQKPALESNGEEWYKYQEGVGYPGLDGRRYSPGRYLAREVAGNIKYIELLEGIAISEYEIMNGETLFGGASNKVPEEETEVFKENLDSLLNDPYLVMQIAVAYGFQINQKPF